MTDLISPWRPEKVAIRVKLLGKLGEEAGELGAVLCRCIIQGIDESEPVTSKPNKQWLAEEVGDVLAGIDLVMEHFNLDAEMIYARRQRKKTGLRRWLAML